MRMTFSLVEMLFSFSSQIFLNLAVKICGWTWVENPEFMFHRFTVDPFIRSCCRALYIFGNMARMAAQIFCGLVSSGYICITACTWSSGKMLARW